MFQVFYLDEVENDVTEVFPYNVHFYIDDKKMQVVIIGIIHNKRSNALLLSR